MQGVLRTSCETLEELHNLSGPSDGRLWADCTLSLTRFSALRSLTLCESMPPSACLLQRLPTSLQRLTITTAGPEKQILRPADGCVGIIGHEIFMLGEASCIGYASQLVP